MDRRPCLISISTNRRQRAGPCSRIWRGSQRPSGGSTPTSSYWGINVSTSTYALPVTSTKVLPDALVEYAILLWAFREALVLFAGAFFAGAFFAGAFFAGAFCPPRNMATSDDVRDATALLEVKGTGAWKAPIRARAATESMIT